MLVLVLVSSGGCQLAAPGSGSKDALERIEGALARSGKATSSDGTQRASATPHGGDRDAADNDPVPTVLAHGTWVRRIAGPSGEVSHEKASRWRHAGLEDLMARPAARRPHFARWIDHANRVVAGNAAIAATRLGDARPVERLVATVESPELTLPARMAAIEALGTIPGRQARQRLDELIQQYGRVARRSGNYLPGIHAELIRALGGRTDGTSRRPFEEALPSPASEVRLAALEAWPANLEVPSSRAAAELVNDPDPRVRVALLDLLITRDSPRALPLVQQALSDHEWMVRARAMEGLGQIGGPVARQAALELLQHRTEHVRAAAVAALHQADASADALVAVDDSSYRVRQAVAAMLPDEAPAETWRAVARRLVTDVHSEVALEVIGHLDDWPLAVAGPILLSAMGSTSYAVRKEATDALGTRWEPASHFAYHAAPSQRDGQLDQLRRDWASEPRVSVGPADPTTRSADHRAAIDRGDAWRTGREAGDSSSRIGSNEGAGKRRVPVRTIEDVESKLRQLGQQTISQGMRRHLEQSLMEMGPELIDALTIVREDPGRLLPEGIYRRVLPAIDPDFDALAELASSDVEGRRQAVGALADHPRQTPLGQLALERLETLIRPDNDPIVWRKVQRIVADDGRDAAIRIELVALTHPVADIRRRACKYFAAHGDARHVAPLVSSLEDTSQSVVVAACAALAEIGTLKDPLPLTRLLASSDVHIRLAAARALTGLGFESGQAALERLARHGDPVIRRQVAQSMGETDDRAAVGTLIGLLDDRMGVRHAALTSLEQLVPTEQWPFAEAANPGVEQRIRRWKRWSARPRARRPGE